MKFRIIFAILILTSCSNGTYKTSSKELYRSSGFALIYDEKDLEKNIISGKLNTNKLEVAHNRVKKNSTILITNPENNKSLKIKVTKKINSPTFFNLVITKPVSDYLNLNPDMPFVEIQEKSKNKSFVAKKAVTHTEEKKVSDKAPVTKVKIVNLSEDKKVKKEKSKNYSIIIGDFYSNESVMDLKETLENGYVDDGILKVKKLSKNKFRLFVGPYSSINTLKKRYFELNRYGFEDLDIQQND